MSSDTWQVAELQAVGIKVADCEHKTPPDAREGYAYVAIPNVVDGRLDLQRVRRITEAHYVEWTRRIRPKGGDVIVTRRGRVGDTAIIPDGLRCAIGQNLVILRSDGAQVEQRYLRWAVRGPAWWQEVDRLRNVGAVFDSLNVRDIARLRLPFPRLEEQRRIADVLNSLDDKIDSNQRTSAAAEAVAKTACRRIAVIGPTPLASWSNTTFAHAVEINPLVRIAKGATVPFLEMAALGHFATRPDAFGERVYKGGARFEHGDTLFARITPCTEHGKGAFVDFLDEPAAGSTEFLVFRAKDPLTPEAVFALSRDERLRAHAIQSMTGTSGRQRVDNACWGTLPVSLAPDSSERDAAAAVIKCAMRGGRAAWAESLTLRAIRDQLLPKLVSGRIRVPAAEEIVDAGDDAALEEAAA